MKREEAALMKRAVPSANVIGLCAAEDGVSAVEFAFVAAFLMIPLVIGSADFGTALFQWMQVGNAARVGAEYATYVGNFNQASIVTAVTNATSLSSISAEHFARYAEPGADTVLRLSRCCKRGRRNDHPTTRLRFAMPERRGFRGNLRHGLRAVAIYTDLSLSRHCAYGRVHSHGADNRAYQLKAGRK